MKTLSLTTNDIKSREGIRDYIDFLNNYHKGKNIDYLITFKKNKPVRSHSANSYYWVVLQCIGVQVGETKEVLHEFFKLEFNSGHVFGKTIGLSTTDLDSTEFSIYLKKVKQYAIDVNGVYISDPADRFYNIWEAQTRERYDAMFVSI